MHVSVLDDQYCKEYVLKNSERRERVFVSVFAVSGANRAFLANLAHNIEKTHSSSMHLKTDSGLKPLQNNNNMAPNITISRAF